MIWQRCSRQKGMTFIITQMIWLSFAVASRASAKPSKLSKTGAKRIKCALISRNVEFCFCPKPAAT